MATQKVLVVGAYERDNFGDYLLLQQTLRYFHDQNVTISGPFDVFFRPLFDQRIQPFSRLLANEKFDLVWTVGGGVGTVGLAQAWAMSRPVEFTRQVEQASGGDQERRLLELVCGGRLPESPYMPRLSSFGRNIDTPSVLNSVGLGGLHKQVQKRMIALSQIVEEASVTAVRERQSQRSLRLLGIPCETSPDIVHTMPLWHPKDDDAGDHVVLQASKSYLDATGLETFASAIANANGLVGREIHLFAAGVAPGHDSLQDYERLADEILRVRPSATVKIHRERDPLKLATFISAAALWIGTSLHGRVIAMAYGIPRVSLSSFKLKVYADSWDTYGSQNVALNDLSDAIEKALSEASGSELEDFGLILAEEVDREMNRRVEATLTIDRQSVLEHRVCVMEKYRNRLFMEF